MRLNNCLRIVACLSAIVLVGCNRKPRPDIVPVTGVVLLDGKPLPKAQLRLMPHTDFGAPYIATAETDDQGRFAMQCNGRPGAPAGECGVTVTEGDAPAELLSETKQRELAAYRRSLKNRPIPRDYASPVSSPLAVVVSPEQSEYTIELTR